VSGIDETVDKTTASTPDLPRGSDAPRASGRRHALLSKLYTGTGAFNIVGRHKLWYLIFGTLMLICLASIVFRGFFLGIEFKGGTSIQMPAQGAAGTIATDRVTDVFNNTLHREPSTVQTVGSGADANVQIKSPTLSAAEVDQLKAALFKEFQPKDPNSGNSSVRVISDSAVSGSWGGEISRQALIALGVFLVLVTIFLGFYFERWMAASALVALIHDIAVTAGIYSIVGFEVTPATVIGLLTILGFSLYDTVVVFDKVKENTRGLLGLTRRTYGEAANLALNQTLMRSINTSLIALLPVLGLLIVGVGLLGVGTLKDLALVQLTGLIAGALSSIFLATPLLVDLKMREPKFQQQAARVHTRRENLARKAAVREASATGEPAPVMDLGDDETLDAELRHERAMAAASSVPVRNPKAADTKRAVATGQQHGKQSGATGQPPARRSRAGGRPSGKKRR
jgi:preprotein translocase subunit SecF